MKFSFPKIKQGSLRKWWRSFMYQWIKRYKYVFFGLFVLVALAGAFQWHLNLERYAWSDEEKRAFLQRTVKETTFQEEKFRSTLDVLADFERSHTMTPSSPRDLFLGKKKKPGER